MLNIKAVIFDFDGTLANTLPVCYYAFQHVFKEYDDKDLSPEEITAMFGPSETGIIRENLLNENIDHAIEYYYAKYMEQHKHLVVSNQDIDNLMYDLKAKGIKIGIVTGKARRSLDISLEALCMNGKFDVIITGDDVERPKPHPEGLLKALALLDIGKNEAVFIGDSDADILAGAQAGVFTVGVQWLPNYQQQEFTIRPNAIFKSISELSDFLEVGVLNEP